MTGRAFSPGDLVALKSGGPVMIVCAEPLAGEVECLFWNEGLHAAQTLALGLQFLSPFGSHPKDEEAASAARTARAALATAALVGPFVATTGAVLDGQGALICDAMPGDAEQNPRVIAAALNAISQEPSP